MIESNRLDQNYEFDELKRHVEKLKIKNRELREENEIIV